jgi:hypothetical protein
MTLAIPVLCELEMLHTKMIRIVVQKETWDGRVIVVNRYDWAGFNETTTTTTTTMYPTVETLRVTR